jgi:hypothetical protein
MNNMNIGLDGIIFVIVAAVAVAAVVVAEIAAFADGATAVAASGVDSGSDFGFGADGDPHASMRLCS